MKMPMSDDDFEIYPENVPGKYFVKNLCIDCQLCADIAPKNFACNEDEEYHYVIKQPENAEEEAQVIEALEYCPTESIDIFNDEIE